MDGNGRWAAARGLPRLAGHHAGARSVRRVVEAAPALGITTLTLFAFSCDNWKRPPDEVAGLMRLFRSHLRSEVEELAENGVRLSVIGRRDRLPPAVLREMERSEEVTAQGPRLHLRLAVDYGGRDAILRAASLLARERGARHEPVTREAFARTLARVMHVSGSEPDLDLLIRTGGEQRISDFLLWESAYAELVFTERRWPEFTGDDLAAAVCEFRRRTRRFGALPAESPVACAPAQPAAAAVACVPAQPAVVN